MKKLINFRPILMLAASICFGILSAFLLQFNNFILFGIVLGIVLTLVILFWVYKKSSCKVKSIFTVIFIFLLAISFVNAFFSINTFIYSDLGDKKLTVIGRVDEQKEIDGGKRLILDNVAFNGSVKGNSKYKIAVYVYGDTAVDVGDRISFYALVNDGKVTYEDRFMAENVSNKLKYSCSVSAEQISVINNQKNFYEKTNLAIRDVLKGGLDKNEFSIAYALMCGNDEYIDTELITNYRYLGVAHIFAVSGLHIGFMAVIIEFILRKLKINKYLKVIITISFLIFYSGVCGFSSSSIRATIMCSVLLISNLLGKKYDGLSSLAFSACIVLLINPLQLFCVGVKLSFTVVFGLIILAKPISTLFKFLPQKIANSLGAVISAQISGLAICLNSFGYFSTISVIANLILLPVVSVLFTSLFTLTVLGGITGLEAVFLFVPNYALKGLNLLIEVLDLKVFLVGGISVGAMSILYYGLLVVISGRINLSLVAKTTCALVLLFSFVTGVTVLTVKERNCVKGYVVGSQSINAVMLTSKEENVLVVSKAYSSFYLGRLNRLKNVYGVKRVGKVVLLNYQKNIDLQEFTTRIRSVFEINSVYCYKTFDKTESAVLEKSFPQISFNYCKEKEGVNTGKNFDFRYEYNGKSVLINYQGKNISIFTELGKNRSDYDITKKIDLNYYIGADYVEQIGFLLNAKKTISFRKGLWQINGEEYGSYVFSL